nr:major facilitator superfamily domain, general substrate transporter [Tanacetum cinerariifolium]
MAYVDGSKCSSVNVIRKRPPTVVWTSELLREREDEELNSGGFGFGEIEGPFVEQEDPMPDNVETLEAAEYMFPGEMEGFFERYVDALKYQGSRKEGTGNGNISDEYRATDAQSGGQNNDGDNNILGDIGMDQDMVVDNIRVTSLRDKHADVDMDHEGTVDDNILGSPTLYNMGPETQEEVLRSVDDVEARIERRKWVDMSDIPIGRLRRDKDKRPVTISEVRKSPFISRVMDADGSLNATEKRVTKYLFEVLEDHK